MAKTIISPRGVIAPYAYIQRPDTKFNDRGVYKFVLTCKEEDCAQLMEDILKVHQENYALVCEEFAKNPPKAKPGKKVTKPYEGDMPFVDNEDGTVSFTFKSYASFKDKKTGEMVERKITVVDGKGKRLPVVPAIAGGSEGKAKFSMVPYGFTAVAGASVKLQLDALMLLKLVEFGAGGEGDWGDETEEDAEDFSGRQFSQPKGDEKDHERYTGNGDEADESDDSDDDGEGDF